MKSIVRAAFAASLMCTAAATAMVLTATTACAQYGSGSSASSSSSHGEGKVSSKVGKPLNDAIKAAQANDFPTALADIKLAQAVDGRTPYDDYKINFVLGFVAVNMKDYPTATTAYEAAADSPEMPDTDKKSIFHNAILLSAAAKHYQKAIAYGQQLETLGGLDSSTEAMVAQSYYFTNDFAHAQHYAQMSVDAAKAAGTAPNEAALDIVMSSEAKQNNQAGAEQTLESLAQQYNKPESWGELVDLALGTKGAKTPDYLALLRLKILLPGAARAEDYTSLANVADQLGYATEAYNVLEKGMSSGKVTPAQAGPTLAHSKSGAAIDERSLGSIATQAEHSKTGEQDIKLAEDYWGYGRFADAETAARRAIAKGGLKDPSEGPLLLGMLLVVQQKYADAVQTLAQVSGTQARTVTAHLWSIYAQAQEKQPSAATQAPAPAPAQQ